ncbi:elongation factor G [Myxococcota bacterium]|nr:elongation factor G [Myxococcota bacterium]
MKTYATDDIRNIALIGQKGSGKTSLGEALLFASKATTRLGRVEDANTVFDFEPEEHKRVSSVQSALAHLEWKKTKINILDTPGDPIFMADATNCMAMVEGMLTVVSAVSGVEPYSVKLFKKTEGRARAIIINAMARERASFERALGEVKEQVSASAVPVTLPIGEEDTFKGVIDLINLKAHIYEEGSQKPFTLEDVPADMLDEATEAREALMEEIAGSDEELMDKYLESGELTEAEAREGLRTAVVSGVLIPVFAADAVKNIGTQEILNTIVASFSCPKAGLNLTAKVSEDEEIDVDQSIDGKPLAVVFRTIVDQHSGKMSLFRVLRGTMTKDTVYENCSSKNSERFGALFTLQGKKVVPVEDAPMGDIAAVAKLKDTATGDTVAAEKGAGKVCLPKPPPTQISFRLHPKTKGEEDKIAQGIMRLRDEDPTLILGHDDLTKELLVSGYGVAHIDIALEKLKRKFGVEVEKAPPNVAYKETFTKSAKNIEGKHKKQSGGRGQFGVCFININPRPRGEGYAFVDKIFGGSIPRQFIPAVDKGVQEAMGRGVLAGYPLVDFEVELIDGKYHDVDSSEMAFKIAGSKAFQTAAKTAGVTIIEPIMDVAVEVPEESMGDIMGDLNSRRGRIQGMDTLTGISTVKAQVPLVEMLTYAPDLKSMTGGRGSFIMTESHYDPIPRDQVDKVIAASPNKPAHAEDE